MSEKAAPFSEKQNQEEEGAQTLNSGQTYINGDEKAVQDKSSSWDEYIFCSGLSLRGTCFILREGGLMFLGHKGPFNYSGK